MALYNWLVQSCCNPSITKVIKYTPILYAGIIFQDSLSNCYQVIAPTNATPNIFLPDLVPLYKTCDDCFETMICVSFFNIPHFSAVIFSNVSPKNSI